MLDFSITKIWYSVAVWKIQNSNDSFDTTLRHSYIKRIASHWSNVDDFKGTSMDGTSFYMYSWK